MKALKCALIYIIGLVCYIFPRKYTLHYTYS